MAEATTQETAPQTEESTDGTVEAHEVELPEASDQPTGEATGKIDVLFDVALPVSARLGEAVILVRELLELAPGSVLKLDKRVGEPIELMMRGKPFAKGQLVVVDEQLGIRISEITSSAPA
jgi:flagellar motor switch protein FliN/FliY